MGRILAHAGRPGRIRDASWAPWAHPGRILCASWTHLRHLGRQMGRILGTPGHPGRQMGRILGTLGTYRGTLGTKRAHAGRMPDRPCENCTTQHNELTFRMPRCATQGPQLDLKCKMRFRVDETAIRRRLPTGRVPPAGPGGRDRHNGNPTRSFGNLIETRTRSSNYHSVSWAHPGHPGHMLGHPGPPWAHPGGTLGHPGRILGVPWAHAGRILGTLGHPGRTLGASWAHAGSLL